MEKLNVLKNLGNVFRLGNENTQSQQENINPELMLTRESFAPLTGDLPNEEILKSIPEEFKQEEFDASYYVLQNLPDHLDEQVLEREIASKMRAMDVIDSKLSEVIMGNYKSFVAGMHQIQEFGNDLQCTTLLLKGGRTHLQAARSKLTDGGFTIISKVKKNRILVTLANDIDRIKSITDSEIEMNEAMQKGDFPKAINLCLKCQTDLGKYQQFVALRGMETKFQESYEEIEDRLENALLIICNKFDSEIYEKILIGFKLLGKVNRIMELFQTHYTSLVDTLIYNIVFQKVIQGKNLPPNVNFVRLKRTPFKELCSMLQEDDNYLPALRTILELSCHLMLTLHSITKWHESGIFESTEHISYFAEIQNKLTRIRKTLWEDIQRKVSAFVGAKPLSNFQFEDFLSILNLINKLIRVGDDFTGVNSPVLRTTVKQQSLAYFNGFHKARMEDLRAMLENETWRPCPVQVGFSIKDLKEFDFSKNVLLSQVPENVQSSVFDKYTPESMNALFEEELKPKNDNQVEHDDDDDIPDELKQDYIDEIGDNNQSQNKVQKKMNAKDTRGPLLSSATIKVVKLIGKYISMTEVLSQIAPEVVTGLSQLVEYYLYSVFKFFTSDTVSKNIFSNEPGRELEKVPIPPKLKTVLTRLHERYDNDDGVLDKLFVVPKMSFVVDLKTQATLYGLAERITACESLTFFAEVLLELKEKLEKLIPPAKKGLISNFYSQTVDTIGDLRVYIYQCVARRLIDFDQILAAINKINWEKKEVTDHNDYINTMNREFKQFKNRIDTNPSLRDVPKDVITLLWKVLITYAIEIMVDGFSNSKKCNDQGRALMQLDFKVLLSMLEKMTNIRPLPHTQFMENFINSYYLTEEETEDWIKTHREYNAKQLMNIINTGVGNRVQRKSKQKFIALIEELEKNRR